MVYFSGEMHQTAYLTASTDCQRKLH